VEVCGRRVPLICRIQQNEHSGDCSAWFASRRRASAGTPRARTNSVYAERRAKLAAQVDGPIILWGFTGREKFQRPMSFPGENFYYLTATTKKAPDF